MKKQKIKKLGWECLKTWVGIFQVGIFWVGIFRVGVFLVGVFLIPKPTLLIRLNIPFSNARGQCYEGVKNSVVFKWCF